MRNKNKVSRRQFLSSSGLFSGAAILRIGAPSLLAITQAACSARDGQRTFAVLGQDEADDLAAIAARIIPTTETPGATEAGVIHFIDNALAKDMRHALSAARSGLLAFNRNVADSYPGKKRFRDLSLDDQDAFLRTQESTAFFGLCWQMTILGFFSMSKYGGNSDHLGWKLIGFEGDRGAWENPFGHYDAEYVGTQSHGE